MYDPARFFNRGLLCGFVFASLCLVPLTASALVTPFLVPDDTGKCFTIGCSTPREVSPKAMPQNAAPATGTARYGFRGTISLSSSIFKQLLILEGAYLAFDWIKSQYAIPPNTEINLETFSFDQKIPISNATCETDTCFFYPGNESNAHFPTLKAALQRAILNAQASSSGYFVVNSVRTYSYGGQYYGSANVSFYNEDGSFSWSGSVDAFPHNAQSAIISPDYLFNSYPLGEPTIAPDPEYTGVILDRFAALVPALREAVSSYVDLISTPWRNKALEPQTGVLKEYEGVLEPIVQPIENPYRTAQPNKLPVIEPAPAVKATDPVTGQEVGRAQTQNITNVQNIYNQQEAVDLSKIEKSVTETGALPDYKPALPDINSLPDWEVQDLVIPEITSEELTQAVSKIRSPDGVGSDQIISKAESIIDFHSFQLSPFGHSTACPPPRTMRFLGVSFALPFDMYCDYMKQVVTLLISLIPFGAFLFFLKKFFVHG